MPLLKHQPPHRARPRAGSKNHARRLDPASQASCVVSSRRNCSNGQYQSQIKLQNLNRHYDSNQQYSITAVSDGGGSVVERYAYSAYGQVTIADASGYEISGSAIANRYTYTGREWDEGLSLNHYRARMYDAVGGRFVSKDPSGYAIQDLCLYHFVRSSPACLSDPLGDAWFSPGGLERRNPRHHWFLAYHYKPSYGQSLVNQKCLCPKIDIDKYTTEYTLNEHQWIHHSVSGETTSPFDSYGQSYFHVLSSAKDCCDLLIKMHALMLAWHSAVRIAIANDYLPDRELPPFDLIPYQPRANEQSTLREYQQAIAIACGKQNQRRTELLITQYRENFLRQIRYRRGIVRPRNFMIEILHNLFPHGVIPVAPRVPALPRISIPLPVAA